MNKETLLIELEDQFLSGKIDSKNFWLSWNSLCPFPKSYCTNEWKVARQKVLKQECEICGSKKHLIIQHRWHPRKYSNILNGFISKAKKQNKRNYLYYHESRRIETKATKIFINENRGYRRLTNPNFITACRDCAFKEDRSFGFIPKDRLTAKEKFEKEEERFSSPLERSRIKKEKRATMTRMIKRKSKK